MAELNKEIIGAVNLTGSFSAIGEILLWSLIVILSLGVLYFVYYIFTFKNDLVVRDAANKRKIIKKIKWKEKRDKNNNVWLVTMFNRIKKPLPPSEAVDLTPRGKKWVEAYRAEDSDTLIWITDTFNYKNYKEENQGFQPLITQERELLVNEIAKSKAYQKRTLYDTIVQISMVMAPIILIAIIGLTLGDITEALTNYATPLTSTLNEVAQSFEVASQNLAGIQDTNNIVTPLEAPN